MPEIEYSVTINRPISEVFRYIATVENNKEWQTDVIASQLSDKNMRTGLMFTESRKWRIWTWRMDLNADVLDYQPNKVIEFKGVLGRFPVTKRYKFASNRGTTEVTQEIEVRTGCLFMLFNPLISSGIMGRTKRTMNKLKEVLEARGGNTNVTNFQNI